MEVGDVVICIDNKLIKNASIKLPLTIGKKYRVLEIRVNLSKELPSIFINNDYDSGNYYKIDRFKTLSDLREEKINNIIN